MDNSIKSILDSNNLLQAVDRIEFLSKGFSNDKKYILWEKNNPLYLLRLSDMESTERRREEFKILQAHFDNGVLSPKPYAFGVTTDNKWCYSILAYIIGDSAEEKLPLMPEDQQYEIGIQAGHELRKLHYLTKEISHESWLNKRLKKYHWLVKRMRDSGLHFFEQEMIESYVEKHLYLLNTSRICYRHDDYHPGNLIIRNGKFAGVIDFNRSDWGDPIEDFYKIPWFTVSVSKPFARGQVKGYMASNTPDDFWARYNLFVAINLHGSIVWAHETMAKELELKWQKHIITIIQTHDFDNNVPPAWFNK